MSPFVALLRTLPRRRRRQFGAAVLLMLAGALAEMLTIGAALPFLALIASPEGARIAPELRGLLERVGDPVLAAALLLIAAAMIATAMRLALNWVNHRFILAIGHDLATRIFARMLRQPYVHYVRRSSSEILSGMEKVQAVVYGALNPAMQALSAATLSVFIVGLLFFIDPLAAGVAATSVAAVYGAVSLAARGRLKRNSRMAAEAGTARVRIVQEGLGGIRDILLDRSQPVFERKFAAIDLRYRRGVAANAFIATAPRYVVEGAGVVALALVALAMSLQPGGLIAAIPVLGALALGAQRLLPLLQQAYMGWSVAAGNLQSAADLVALLDMPITPEPPPAPARRGGPMLARDIVFDRVSFSRDDGGFSLKAVNLAVRAGTRVGITGPTGGGKSTLLDLLMGLLEPDTGAILIDGQPLDAATRPLWQGQIAHVPQAVHLADDTIAANIVFPLPAESVDGERLRDAARAACLESFIEGLPLGFETKVGERGIRLSGGQRQRIGLARALYRRAPVLILDEATSALDDETEAAVMEGIAALSGKATVVMVAHRASTLAGCDCVFRIVGGRAVSRAPAA